MSKEKTKGLAESVLIWLVNIYVVIMMAIYPLVVGNKYYDISDVKWALWLRFHLCWFILLSQDFGDGTASIFFSI